MKLNKENKQDFKPILKEKGLKITPARLEILGIFENSKLPLDAQGIYMQLKKLRKAKNVDEVTVYRNLTKLEEDGILKRVNLRKDAIYYELNIDDHHHHIVCTDCGKLEDFELCDMDILTKKIIAKAVKL